eukprot:8482515-Pyramimonas_sp.AAC.1
MIGAFSRQISGLNLCQLGQLLKCGRGEGGVYIMDAWSKTARVPKRGELAWDVEYLVRHHKKHIFGRQRTPNLEE